MTTHQNRYIYASLPVNLPPKPAFLTVRQPTNLPHNQPANLSHSQPVNPSHSQPVNPSHSQPVNIYHSHPTCITTTQPFSHPANLQSYSQPSTMHRAAAHTVLSIFVIFFKSLNCQNPVFCKTSS